MIWWHWALLGLLGLYPAITFVLWYVGTAYYVFGETIGRLLPAPPSSAAELAIAVLLSPLWLAAFPLLMPLYLYVGFSVLLGEKLVNWFDPGAGAETVSSDRRWLHFVVGAPVVPLVLTCWPFSLLYLYLWRFLACTVIPDLADRLRGRDPTALGGA